MIGENAVRRSVTSIWSAAASSPWRMIEAVTGSIRDPASLDRISVVLIVQLQVSFGP